MPFTCRTRARTRPPRPAPTMVTGVVIVFLRNLLDCHSNDASTSLDYYSNEARASLERPSTRGRMGHMATKSGRAPRRMEALSREVIVKAATEILDAEG